MNKSSRSPSLEFTPPRTAPDTSARARNNATGAVTRSSPDRVRTWMHDALVDLAPASRILAVGCDEAFLAPQLAEYATDVTVLDTSAVDLAQLARRFPQISFAPHNPSSRLPFPNDSFDAIWCGELLDRVFDPAATLSELRRVLVSSGRLLVTVPDHGPVRHALAALLGHNETGAGTNPRIHYFTRHGLVKLTRQAGFEELQTTSDAPKRNGTGHRRLLLSARKGRGALVTPLSARAMTEAGAVDLMADLAFASRTHAA